MFVIALMYCGAAIEFAWHGRWWWALLAVLWGSGNAVLGYLASE